MNAHKPTPGRRPHLWLAGLAASITPLTLGSAGLFLKRLTICLLGAALSLILIAAGVVYLLWHNEIGALMRFEQVRERIRESAEGAKD